MLKHKIHHKHHVKSYHKNSKLSHDEIFCVQCKKSYKLKNISDKHFVKTKNHRLRLVGKCPLGHNISKFVSKEMANGSGLLGKLLGMPNGELIPGDSNIPIIGALL